MKRVLVGLFLVFLFMAFAQGNSSADICGCMGTGEKGMYEEGMPMIGGANHRGMGMMRDRHRIWMHLRGLGLDDTQEEAIRDIRNKLVKDSIRKGADIRITGVELKEILQKDPVDIQAVEAKLRQIASLQTDLRMSFITAIEEVKAKLTPEQREQFKKKLKRHRGWMHGGKGMTPHCEKKGKKQPAEHTNH